MGDPPGGVDLDLLDKQRPWVEGLGYYEETTKKYSAAPETYADGSCPSRVDPEIRLIPARVARFFDFDRASLVREPASSTSSSLRMAHSKFQKSVL